MIRLFNETDREFVLNLASRFSEIPFKSYRKAEAMAEIQREIARKSLEINASNIWIAENEDGIPIGYIELSEDTDYFSGKDQAYISAIAVSAQGEGKGVGKQLMKKAEEWAMESGYSEIVLDVFQANNRAVRFYECLGYETEIVKMVKSLH